jgi:hypothetical protein
MSFSGNNEPVTTGTRTVTTNVRQLSDGNPSGTVLGKSPTDLIGFYGQQPVTQPGTGGTVGGNFTTAANVTTYGNSISPASVAANTSAEQSITVTGVLATDVVTMIKPTTQAGLIVGTARVASANTVDLTFGNVTASPITPTSTQVYATIAIGAALQTSAVLTPAAVASNTVSEQLFTVAGVAPGQEVIVNKPTAQAGLIITNCRASGTNQVAIQFSNLTGATLTPTAAETYLFASAGGFQPPPIMDVFTQTLTPVSVAANTGAEQTFTVTGLVSGGKVLVTKPSVTAGLMLAGARVSAANTLALNFANNTAAAITPPSEAYQIAYFTTQAGNTDATTTIQPAARGNDTAALASLGLISGT